jgi:hypothetical protein
MEFFGMQIYHLATLPRDTEAEAATAKKRFSELKKFPIKNRVPIVWLEPGDLFTRKSYHKSFSKKPKMFQLKLRSSVT